MSFTSGWAFVADERVTYANTTTGTLDGNIDASVTIPSDATNFPAYVEGGTNNNIFVQTRVWYNLGSTDTGNKAFGDYFANGYIRITDTPTRINDLTLVNLKVFPNPASNNASLTIDASEFEGSADVFVYDMSGARVKALSEKAGVISLETSGLAKGLYTVVVKDAAKVAFQKVVLK
jgi:hypothetical protein